MTDVCTVPIIGTSPRFSQTQFSVLSSSKIELLQLLVYELRSDSVAFKKYTILFDFSNQLNRDPHDRCTRILATQSIFVQKSDLTTHCLIGAHPLPLCPSYLLLPSFSPPFLSLPSFFPSIHPTVLLLLPSRSLPFFLFCSLPSFLPFCPSFFLIFFPIPEAVGTLPLSRQSRSWVKVPAVPRAVEAVCEIFSFWYSLFKFCGNGLALKSTDSSSSLTSYFL